MNTKEAFEAGYEMAVNHVLDLVDEKDRDEKKRRFKKEKANMIRRLG